MNRIYRLLLSYALIIYATLFCVVGVLGYATWRIATDAAVERSAQAWLVDAAGRQRMLAQRFAKEMLLLGAATEPAARERWRSRALGTVAELIEGHASVREHGRQHAADSPARQEAQRHMAALDQELSRFAVFRAALAAGPASRIAETAGQAAVLERSERYVGHMEQVVAHIAEEARETAEHLQRMVVYVAVPLLVALLLGTLIFFWPLVRRLRASHAELQAANEQLQAAVRERQRLAKAVEQSADGILICGPDARIQYANPAFEYLTGWPRSRVIGRTPAFLRSEHTAESTYDEMWRTIQAGFPWRGELTDVHHDGTHFEVQLGITPLREGRELQGYVGTMRDVTHQKALEGQLRHARKLEAIGALAGGIAHDFNNILTPIMGYTELALKRLPADAPDRDGLTRVLNGARRARDLVRQILAFSRQSAPAREPVDMAQLLDEAVQLMQATKPADVTVETHVEPGLHPAEGNASELHTVLLNLCVNALQAMPGGGRLTLTLGRAERSEAGAPAEVPPGCGLLRLTVSDTGQGMDAETLERAFDPFFTTKPVGEGTGLGLSAVYGIVTRHQGSVQLESSPGEGATFRVYLPSRPAPPVERAAASAQAPVPVARRGRILLAEDEADIVHLASNALAAAGHEVRVARDGAEAWATFERQPDAFDLVITDLSMPNLSGWDFLRRVHGLRPGMPVVLVSGHDLPTPHLQPRNGHRPPRTLQKPYAVDALLGLVQEQLSG